MIEIVRMMPAHTAQVAALEKLCFSDPWSENSVASELKNELACWFVAEQDGIVVGYIGSQTVMGETDMMNVAVHPDYRRRGIAEALVTALVEELKKRESLCLTLEVRVSNASARRLYDKLGFEQIGLRRNYYRSPKEDALILKKRFETSR